MSTHSATTHAVAKIVAYPIQTLGTTFCRELVVVTTDGSTLRLALHADHDSQLGIEDAAEAHPYDVLARMEKSDRVDESN